MSRRLCVERNHPLRILVGSLVRLLDLCKYRIAVSYWTRRGAKIEWPCVIVHMRVAGDPRNVRIRSGTSVRGAFLLAHDRVSIGKNCIISNDAAIITGSHDIDDPGFALITAPVDIEDFCWIAPGAKLLPGTHLGRGAVVGASCVVKMDVPPMAVVVGNPARIVRWRTQVHAQFDPRGTGWRERLQDLIR